MLFKPISVCDARARKEPSQWPVSRWLPAAGSGDGGLLVRRCELQSLEPSQELPWEERKLQGLEMGLQVAAKISGPL